MVDRLGNIERWAATAATLVDLAKRDLPPHISEAEQVEAYLGLKRIAADYRGAVDALMEIATFTDAELRTAGEQMREIAERALDATSTTSRGAVRHLRPPRPQERNKTDG